MLKGHGVFKRHLLFEKAHNKSTDEKQLTLYEKQSFINSINTKENRKFLFCN